VAASVELGSFVCHGSFRPWHLTALSGGQLKEQLFSWVVGSLLLGLLAGGAAAIVTAAVVYWTAPSQRGLRERIRFVNRSFAGSAQFDRGFVRWKMRLDRIFSLLASEDLGSGTVVDLGCGYGMALIFAAFGDRGRRLVGCDLNAHRIAVAQQALRAFNAEASVQDVRDFALPPAGLILILDVLQYLPGEEQLALLKRCCAALEPGGRLIFRVHDRERGLRTVLTLGLDRLLFSAERVGVRPTILSAAQYRVALQESGMAVEERRFRNRLPLAHILFLARRPATESAS
jgi:SAM-dependent methyltransferase